MREDRRHDRARRLPREIAYSGRRKEQLTTAEEAQVHKAAENIIQAATMDDVRRYSPAFHRVSSAAKKGAANRVGVKRAVARKVAVNQAAVKRRPATKKGTKKR